MKNTIHLILALGLCGTLASCSATSTLTTDPKTVSNIAERSIERPAHITLRTGESLEANSVMVRKDSTRWFSAADGAMKSVPTPEITSIELSTPHVGSGIVYGGISGLLLGAAIGALVFLGETATTGLVEVVTFGFSQVPQPTYPSGFPLGGMLMGGLIGAGVGSGHTTTYVLSQY